MNSYESRRVTISSRAAKRLCEIANIPEDAPTQALGSLIEELIFLNWAKNQCDCDSNNSQTTHTPVQDQPVIPTNKSKLHAAAIQFKSA